MSRAPVPVTAASQLMSEVCARLEDPRKPVGPAELRTMLRHLRKAQRSASSDELASLFGTIGNVCFYLREFRDALDACRNAARYDTLTADYLANAAGCLCELNQFPQALVALREARTRPVKNPGAEVCILANMADVEHHLGNVDAAYRAYEEAVRCANPARPHELLIAANAAAGLGNDDDAAELFARAIAVAEGTALGETPAIEFVLADPDRMRMATAKSASLGDALARAVARYVAEIPAEHQLGAQVTLPPAAFAALDGLIEHPPEPTKALRMVFDESRP